MVPDELQDAIEISARQPEAAQLGACAPGERLPAGVDDVLNEFDIISQP
jgi:hypothetical protein